MTTYVSCRGCLVNRHSCANRKRIEAAIRGLHVTSLKFGCADRVSKFKPGQRVIVMWKFPTGDGYYESGMEEVKFKATVLSEVKPGRFHIKVDDGPCHDAEEDPDSYSAPDCLQGNGYASATYSRLEALDEPNVSLCVQCGGLPNGDDCWGSPHLNPDCIKHFEVRAAS